MIPRIDFEFPNDRPYSRSEAYISFSLDKQKGITGSVRGYAKLWQWGRTKTASFILELKTCHERAAQQATFAPLQDSNNNNLQKLTSHEQATLRATNEPPVSRSKDLSSSLNLSSSLGERILDPDPSSRALKTNENENDFFEENRSRWLRFARRLYEESWIPLCAERNRGVGAMMGPEEQEAGIKVAEMCQCDWEQAEEVLKIYVTWKTKEGRPRGFRYLPMYYNDVLASKPKPYVPPQQTYKKPFDYSEAVAKFKEMRRRALENPETLEAQA